MECGLRRCIATCNGKYKREDGQHKQQGASAIAKVGAVKTGVKQTERPEQNRDKMGEDTKYEPGEEKAVEHPAPRFDIAGKK